VEVDLAVVVKELFDQASIVGREVVEDDVNLLRGRALSDDFMEEGHEVLAGVAGCGFAVHATGGGFQQRIQREGSVTVILETVALDPPRREGQDGIEPDQICTKDTRP